MRKPPYPRNPKYTSAEQAALGYDRIGKKFYKRSVWYIPNNQTLPEFKGINIKQMPTKANDFSKLISQLQERVQDVQIKFEVDHTCSSDEMWGCECENSVYLSVSGLVEIEADEELINAYNSAMLKKTEYEARLKEYQKKIKVYRAEQAAIADKKRKDAEYKRYLKLKEKYESDGTT